MTKVLAYIALVLTVLGSLSLVSQLISGIDVEVNVFALAYMALVGYVLARATTLKD